MPTEAATMAVCRACLAPLLGGAAAETLKGEVARNFTFCTSVEVSECDDFPKAVCRPCMCLLDQALRFKQTCIRSNETLLQSARDAIKREPSPVDDDFDRDDYLQEDFRHDSDNDKDTDWTPKPLVKTHPRHAPNETKVRVKIKKEKKEPRAPKYKLNYSCLVCNKKFAHIQSLEHHTLAHQGIKKENVCHPCNKFFKTWRSLENHIEITHKKVDQKVPCHTCGRTFRTPLRLSQHQRIHREGYKKREEKMSMCHICGKDFRCSVLSHHVLRHLATTKEHPCGTCGKRFSSRSGMRAHALRHGERHYLCDMCDMRFFDKNAIKRHMNVHLGAKPYHCKICDKRYATSSFLAEHHRIHTGERPYRCDFCPMAFVSSTRLLEHRRAHVGDKRYKCHICGHAFVQCGTYKRHLRVHEKLERP